MIGMIKIIAWKYLYLNFADFFEHPLGCKDWNSVPGEVARGFPMKWERWLGTRQWGKRANAYTWDGQHDRIKQEIKWEEGQTLTP